MGAPFLGNGHNKSTWKCSWTSWWTNKLEIRTKQSYTAKTLHTYTLWYLETHCKELWILLWDLPRHYQLSHYIRYSTTVLCGTGKQGMTYKSGLLGQNYDVSFSIALSLPRTVCKHETAHNSCIKLINQMVSHHLFSKTPQTPDKPLVILFMISLNENNVQTKCKWTNFFDVKGFHHWKKSSSTQVNTLECRARMKK